MLLFEYGTGLTSLEVHSSAAVGPEVPSQCHGHQPSILQRCSQPEHQLRSTPTPGSVRVEAAALHWYSVTRHTEHRAAPVTRTRQVTPRTASDARQLGSVAAQWCYSAPTSGTGPAPPLFNNIGDSSGLESESRQRQVTAELAGA